MPCRVAQSTKGSVDVKPKHDHAFASSKAIAYPTTFTPANAIATPTASAPPNPVVLANTTFTNARLLLKACSGKFARLCPYANSNKHNQVNITGFFLQGQSTCISNLKPIT